MGEEHDLSTVLGFKGCDEEYTDASTFTNRLDADFPLSWEIKFGVKRVFWSPEAYEKSPIIQNKIKTLVGEDTWHAGLTQFWAPKVDGRRCYLTTSDQPFAVDGLYRGLCWYRKLCMDHLDIVVDKSAKEEQLGAVGRVFLNGYPESTPDLRLYSTNELPLRDFAARCGVRAYFVLPVFDLLKKECYGVLEYLGFGGAKMRDSPLYMLRVEQALQKAELRTTHLKKDQTAFDELENPTEGATQLHMARDEITKMLQVAMEMVSQLHMAQIWIPCKQCANISTSLCCMELVDYMVRIFPDKDLTNYLDASNFHGLQLRKGIIAKMVMSSSNIKCFCRNICDFSLSENPLAHYAQKSRLSFCFAICLECVHNNDLYYLEFFLHPYSGRDPCAVSLCLLLIEVMETVLKSFKFISSDMLEVRKDILSKSIELVPHKTSATLESEKHRYVKEENILTKMNRGWEMYPSEMEFEEYLQMDDHFSCFKSFKVITKTWLFWCPQREELCENDENFYSAILLHNSTRQMIKLLFHNLMMSINMVSQFSLVQFWAPEMDEERCYLTTSSQTFILFGLHKGLAFLRKQSMKHQYFVDEGVKEEELGPIGRVFRSGHPEMTHDLRLYSTTEFPLKEDAAFCNITSYIAFPVFDHQHKCLGVLEVIGKSIHIEDRTLQCIQRVVKEAHLSSTHIHNEPKFHGGFALMEIENGLLVVEKIAQLHAAEVWVPNSNCSNTNNSLTCMRRVVPYLHEGVQFDPFETGKGIAGMVLASESKCCYCRNSCQFSITDRSRPHHAQRERLDVCFAICLQSSYTGDLPFVLKFLLNQGPGHYEYLWSFLYYLLPILKQQLKSFKVATGKQLGDELVVDIIEFPHEVNRPTSLQFGHPNMFPAKFQIVQYGQQKYQQSNDEQVNEMDHGTRAVADGNQCTTTVASLQEETSRKTEKVKMRTGLRITLEDLKGQFGKNREDAAKNLSVSISTFKRSCRFHNIHRWPSKKEHRKKPSLYMTEGANAYDGDPQQSRGPSSSSLRLPLHENVPPTNIEGNQDLTIVPETDLVIIKAKYEDEIVKFRFCLSTGLVNLAKEVATRLKLEMERFTLKYVDEDNDHISLTCDTDLQLYVESAKVAGKNSIPVFVQLMR